MCAMERLQGFLHNMLPVLPILVMALGLGLWQLDKVPSGLYWDEMDAGYQAYSFLKTGKDYYGNALPIHFHSFADFRTPLYIYATVPFVALFDLTAWAVRLPALLFGLCSITVFYFLIKELTASRRWGFVGAWLLALSPWHFQYSRMGFEATAMLAPFLLGLYAFFKTIKNPQWLIVSAIGFGLSPWAYSTAKFFVPITLLLLIVVFRKHLFSLPIKYIGIAATILAVFALPLMYSNFFGGGGTRFAEISVFTDPTVGSEVDTIRREVALSTTASTQPGIRTKLINRLNYNKPLFWLNEITINYLQTFSTDFLFIEGDGNVRHSPKTVGQLARITAIPLLVGIAVVFYSVFLSEPKSKGKKRYDDTTAEKRLLIFLLLWLFSAPLPAAITREGGTHATRLFFLLPVLIILITLGVRFLDTVLSPVRKMVVITMLAGIFFVESFFFVRYYFSLYRWESAPEYQYGYARAVELAKQYERTYDRVVIDTHGNSALMAYLFTLRLDPTEVQQMLPLKSETFLFGEGNQFGKIVILHPGERSWQDILFKNTRMTNTAYIIAATQIRLNRDQVIDKFKGYTKLIDVIPYPDNSPAFFIMDTNIDTAYVPTTLSTN